MIAQGKEYAKSLGLTNLQFHLCDFDTLDLKKKASNGLSIWYSFP